MCDYAPLWLCFRRANPTSWAQNWAQNWFFWSPLGDPRDVFGHFWASKTHFLKSCKFLAKNSVWCSWGPWMEPKWTPKEWFFLLQKSIKILLFPCKKQCQRHHAPPWNTIPKIVFMFSCKKSVFSQPMVLPQPNWGFRGWRTVFLRFLGLIF